jgi:hypothetical protein
MLSFGHVPTFSSRVGRAAIAAASRFFVPRATLPYSALLKTFRGNRGVW